MISMVKSKNVILDIIVVIILMYCLNVPNSIFSFRYYEWIPIVVDIVIVGTLLALHNGKLKLQGICRDLFSQFFIPLIVPTIIAAITAVLIYRNTRYTMSSFKYILWVYGAYVLAYILYQKYKYRLFNFICIAGTVSYFTAICKGILYMDTSYYEVHELTYVYGMLLLFVSLSSEMKKKKTILVCLTCIIGILLGNKRALWLALAVSYGIYFAFYKLLNNKSKGLKFVAVISILIGFVWIWFIQTGYFELACIRFGINDMSRLKMWNYFRSDYIISPLYFGRGLTYTLVVMDEIHSALFISHGIPIHNWVLSTYIGWGFIPFLYYLYIFLYRRVTCLISKGTKKLPWIFLSVTILFYVVNFFGDTMFNIGISILYMGIWLFLQEQNAV